MKQCPSCQSQYRSRLEKKGFQVFKLFIKYYICVRCRTKYGFNTLLNKTFMIRESPFKIG